MYKHHRPDKSIDIRFGTRLARTKKGVMYTPDAKPDHDCVVQVSLTIGHNEYGPYSTGIKTFQSAWKGRQNSRLTYESKELIKELCDYQELLESVHETLLQYEQPIDGELLINTARRGDANGKVVTLARVYAEFMQARANMVEPNQEKRSVDQISESTFNSYPKRWEMIQGYLVSVNRSQMPVAAVLYSFATELKEWLAKQNKSGGRKYQTVTINKAISFLKQLMTYALSKGYIGFNPIRDFACRGGSVANPKPLTKEQLDHLETCQLPFLLRSVCDSWLVAGELCLHYADYMKLPNMRFIERDGIGFIQHTRSKQQGSNLKQTVNITDRAKRLINKYGGVRGLYYRHSYFFSKALKEIAVIADLRDEKGEIIGLQFGQGRDSGLTQRAIDGANGIQLSKIAGWSRPAYAERYIGNPVDVVGEFVKTTGSGQQKPTPSNPFSKIHKAS